MPPRYHRTPVQNLRHSPNGFIDSLRPFLHRPPFAALLPKPEYTMLGRTYALGYEPDLDETPWWTAPGAKGVTEP